MHVIYFVFLLITSFHIILIAFIFSFTLILFIECLLLDSFSFIFYSCSGNVTTENAIIYPLWKTCVLCFPGWLCQEFHKPFKYFTNRIMTHPRITKHSKLFMLAKDVGTKPKFVQTNKLFKQNNVLDFGSIRRREVYLSGSSFVFNSCIC